MQAGAEALRGRWCRAGAACLEDPSAACPAWPAGLARALEATVLGGLPHADVEALAATGDAAAGARLERAVTALFPHAGNTRLYLPKARPRSSPPPAPPRPVPRPRAGA